MGEPAVGERYPNERGAGAGGRGDVGRHGQGMGTRPAAGDRRRGAGGGWEVFGVLRGADREREDAGGVRAGCRGTIGERSDAIVRAGVLEDPQGRARGPRASRGAAPRRRVFVARRSHSRIDMRHSASCRKRCRLWKRFFPASTTKGCWRCTSCSMARQRARTGPRRSAERGELWVHATVTFCAR